MSENMETIGLSGKTALVHKHGSEGSLTIDPATGYIITPHDERPDWAEDLTIAQMAERHAFYTNRLADHYTADHQQPEVYAFEDLSWLGARELPETITNEDGTTTDQELFTVDADEQFRMEQIATVLGVEAEVDEHGNETGEIAGALASIEMAADDSRSAEEVAELEKQQATGFRAVNQ